MTLFVVASLQDTIGGERKEKSLEKLLEIGLSKYDYIILMKNLEEKYPDK